MANRTERLIDVVTLVASLGAIVIATVAVTRSSAGVAGGGTLEDREVENWEDLVSDGQRLGPPNATVTILEFGDYECPACRGWEPQMQQLLADFPDDLALVYRHMPLAYHARAYPAARAAVCAAERDRFWQYHRALYASESLDEADFVTIADSLGLADLEGFQRCISQTSPVPTIEADIQASQMVGAGGTPTFIINGVLLGDISPSAVRDRVQELVNDR